MHIRKARDVNIFGLRDGASWARFVCVVLVWVLANCGGTAAQELQFAKTAKRPNVLFIAIDDLNDWLGCLGGHPQSASPNIDALAQRGTLFTNAHCNAPLCNASRTSLMLGLRPSTTGVYALQPNFRSVPELAEAVTIPEHFLNQGYRVAMGGKVFHGNSRSYLRNDVVHGPFDLVGRRPPEKLVVTPGGNHPLVDWGTFDHEDQERGDYRTASWACEQIAGWADGKPNFLAVGFFLPHVPLYAPPKWFAMFPEDEIQLPEVRESARAGTPDFSWNLHWDLPEPRLSWLRDNHQWRPLVRAYLASVAFVDAQVGRVLDQLEKSGQAENTLVVLWSDHGWHLGEKEITGKNSLWEESTRVPLIFAGPGVTASQECGAPVELIDIYPTLVELAELPRREELEGLSLVPQLRDAATERQRPAVTTHNRGNHSVRTRHWKLIRYANAVTELYNLDEDPNEWANRCDLSGQLRNPQDAEAMRRLEQWLPQTNAPPVAGSGGRLLIRDGDRWMWEGKEIIPSERIK